MSAPNPLLDPALELLEALKASRRPYVPAARNARPPQEVHDAKRRRLARAEENLAAAVAVVSGKEVPA